MKKVWYRFRKIKKRWYVVFLLWLLVMTWGTCRIYADAKLEQLSKRINNEQIVFEYSEDWGELTEIQADFEKEFLETIAHVTRTSEKDSMINLEWDRILTSGGVIEAEYKDTVPYKIAYFYPFDTSYKFEDNVWRKSEKEAYLDVVTIQKDGDDTYVVSVSKEDLDTIQENKEKLLAGDMQLRPKSFDETPYNQLEDEGFYTYLKDDTVASSPYTYLYVEQREKSRGYSDSSKERVLYNALIFRYKVYRNSVDNWNNVYGTIDIVDQKGFTVQQENDQLLENINNRTKTEKALEKDFEKSVFYDLEELVVIQGTEELLTDSDFYRGVSSAENREWNECMEDPNKKAIGVKETVVGIYYDDKMILLDKYMKEKDGIGRNDLVEAEGIMRTDIEKNGEASEYYKWLSELALTNWNKGMLSVDFGDGIVN